jgi:predicted N-acetyltransferase YhbS
MRMSTNLQRLRINAADRDRHDEFFSFVAAAFGGVDFRSWAARGGWNEDYQVFALTDHDDLISTIGSTRMDLVIDGVACVGYQLGAVATRRSHRGRGVARELMQWVIDEADPHQPMLLFANDSVLEFYPRFGFRRVMQQRFAAPIDMHPAALAPTWDLAIPAHRSQLEQLCRRAAPIGTRFAARNYFSTLLWHLTHRPLPVYRFDQFDAAIVASTEGDRLILHDLVATKPFALERVLPALIETRVSEIEFRFHPERWWPGAVAVGIEDRCPLFVRGATALRESALRFPDLAHT